MSIPDIQPGPDYPLYPLFDPLPLKTALEWFHIKTNREPTGDDLAWAKAHNTPMSQLDFTNMWYDDFILRPGNEKYREEGKGWRE